MGQVPDPNALALCELKPLLEAEWPARIAALAASGCPLALYDDLTDEQLRARATELGIEVEDDTPRAEIEAAVAAKEKTATKPPWGSDDEFDPERAWTLIEKLRADVKTAATVAAEARAKAQEYEDRDKSEAQKLEERATTAEGRAAKAENELLRARVALKKGLTDAQAKRLIGETEEELEADADELLESFTATEEDDGSGVPRRPRERMRSGAAPSATPEIDDPAELAKLVPRG